MVPLGLVLERWDEPLGGTRAILVSLPRAIKRLLLALSDFLLIVAAATLAILLTLAAGHPGVQFPWYLRLLVGLAA